MYKSNKDCIYFRHDAFQNQYFLATVPQGAPTASVQALSTASEAVTAPAATAVTANVGPTAIGLIIY
jgi:hypothetical protein